MSLVAAVSKERTFRDVADNAVERRTIDSSEFVGKRVRINGGNYVHETVIVAVQVALKYQTEKDLQEEYPIIKNIRLRLENPVVSIDKGRCRMSRTIDHLSYAASGIGFSDTRVVFQDDGLEPIKSASMVFLD